ncbi:hypothetical protein ACFO3K_17885 [Cellulomonas algicola]|uniref:Uncharacterized protein n=1 Tax=Cellulomonas algicola TaxID=2071633 RepID=A0A401UW85_9CELL|nr:hypothetical protein [Cellulomonas algicola]GCD18844.1 hypothetical protein CTKZ_04060 [Cellulomonas algicola]
MPRLTDAELRATLAAAVRERTAVRVTRRIRKAASIDGYVVDVGRAWLLVAVLGDDIRLDGWTAVRLSDVRRVRERVDESAAFYRAALTARGEWPPGPPSSTGSLDLDDVGGLVRTAGAAAPLVTIHVEEDDPSVCFVGRPERVGPKHLRLREITPGATWDDTTTRWRLRDLTRVDVGGGYEDALALVGGPPPA